MSSHCMLSKAIFFLAAAKYNFYMLAYFLAPLKLL